MAPATHILALDQGTTSTRAIVFDGDGQPVSSSQIDLMQHYPKPGWVEHDPEEIAGAVIAASRNAVKAAGLEFTDITCIGITNQRETTVIWDRESAAYPWRTPSYGSAAARPKLANNWPTRDTNETSGRRPVLY